MIFIPSKYPCCVTSNFSVQHSREAPQNARLHKKCGFFLSLSPADHLESRDRLPAALPTVNNAAPERRQGAESPHSEGGNHIYGAFSPDDRRQNPRFFAQNVSAATLRCRSGREGAVISRRGCSISTQKAELERNPNSEPRQDGGC